MKWIPLFRIIAVALILSVSGRFGYLELSQRHNQLQTVAFCNAVANFLETGSLREAYEGLLANLNAVGDKAACIALIDNGRSFAPHCLAPETRYQVTICKAEANTGVRAEIHYPLAPLFSIELVFLWLLLSFGLLGIVIGFGALFSIGAKRITAELHHALFENIQTSSVTHPQGVLRRLTEQFLSGTGILNGVRRHTQQFEERLRSFEAAIREETALRVRKETEAEKYRQYSDRVKKIQHDFKSSLSSLRALQDSLKSDEAQHLALKSGIRGMERMLEDLNQIEAVERPLQLTIVEVVAEEAVAGFRAKLLNAKKATLSLEYATSGLSPVMANTEDLRRVFDNLLENALDAIPTNGKVRIHIHSADGKCVIDIDDNGSGIAPEHLPKLFSKGATFDKIHGTGLGLFQVKTNVESWKGAVVCVPLSCGTRFSITLSIVQTGVTYSALPDEGRVVIVDDDPTVAQSLERAGVDVLRSASNYREGKALLESEIPEGAAILVDFRLDQGLLGTDLIAETGVKQNQFLCTNDFDNPDTIKRARHVGVGIIPKPLCFLASAVE